MLLPELFEKNGIDYVDLFFLDVEGRELTVLETFDWSVPVDIFVIEMDGNNPQKDEAVRQLLFGHGYVTPFSLLGECTHCTQSEVFVSREISDRKFGNNSTVISDTTTEHKPATGEAKSDQEPVAGEAKTVLEAVAGEAKTVLEVDIDLITVTTNCTANLSVPFYSQYSEDTRIFHKFYAEDPKCGGVVVEIGGLDGITFSNSWFFEYALHWKALLIEASADNYAKMVVNRPNATNVFGAVCRGKSISFQPAHHGAVGGAAKDMSAAHKKRFIDESLALVEVPCMLLPELFEKNGIDYVDLFFLDVEGRELTVLETFDWSVPVDIFVIEMDGNNPQKDEAVRQLLFGHGYVTPFSLLGECTHCTQSEVFVSREISDRKFGNNSTVISDTTTEHKPATGEAKSDQEPVAGEAKSDQEVDIDLITVTTNCTANLSVPFYSQYWRILESSTNSTLRPQVRWSCG
ncbi:methyltransferase [Fragilaria crotonensis]|nr:methyltransferase [Fragilaria crotonensis]